ncbi:MAG: hypothetical protein PHY73_05675 [Candidatus Omnitrophica bacterium]|nr:hypothetical protein [Candidatus Omnitrophota bacterium]
MLAFGLLIFGVAMRLFVHPANFTPVLALVLFGGVYLDKKYAMIFPVFLMMATDIILGAHSVMIFTWGSLLLISAIGLWLRNKKSAKNVIASSLVSAFVFFVITNFGVWLSGYYPLTLKGLSTCFMLAIPFFRMTLLSTIGYSIVFFGVYEILAKRIKQTRFAHVL